MTKRNAIAQLGRDEHDDREARRKAKRDLRRGGKRQPKDPDAGRNERKANMLASNIDALKKA